ncbi:MAG: hypothetical protein JNM17_36190 [Archangium sp.]|nr:hypothetical protein [Archangium sp.]
MSDRRDELERAQVAVRELEAALAVPLALGEVEEKLAVVESVALKRRGMLDTARSTHAQTKVAPKPSLAWVAFSIPASIIGAAIGLWITTLMGSLSGEPALIWCIVLTPFLVNGGRMAWAAMSR